ncbi:hypothetical protein [Chryseobacterium mulctrae]|nr:hypothetical protein [Chryseobacterium mulctrae]
MKKNYLQRIKEIDSKEIKLSSDKNIIYYDINKPKNVVKTFDEKKRK